MLGELVRTGDTSQVVRCSVVPFHFSRSRNVKPKFVALVAHACRKSHLPVS